MPVVTKKKGQSGLCVGLVLLILLVGLFPFAGSKPVSASPDRLKWSIVDTPSEEGNVVVSPSEINAFVIGSDDETFYAIDIPGDLPGGRYPNGKVYKSIDDGVTWDDDLTSALEDEGATLPAWDISVAPDDPELVAVVTDNRTAVYVSDDGGENWENADVPHLGDLLISDIAISTEYDDYHDVAIGTRDPNGQAYGDVWVRRLEGFGTWKTQELQIDSTFGGDVTSIRFSPNYDEDKAIVVIASDANNTYLCVGERNTNENRTWWYASIEIIDLGENNRDDSPSKNEIIFSNLALRSEDYSEDGDWIAYAGYYSTTDADDVYRVEKDGTVRRLRVKGGAEVPIASIDYGGGKLLAGKVAGDADSASALVHICFNPEEYFPDWEKPSQFKSPTGGAVSQRANAQLVWSSNGEKAYCGTSTNHVTNATDWANTTLPSGPWRGQDSDESAFSVSEDDGDTWNQLSLIDTNMDYLSDYALSADTENGKTLYYLYLASVGSGFDSIWRSESETSETLGETWERILCPAHEDNVILRPSPEEDEEAIFFAIVNTTDARYSLDKGQTWERVWDCSDVTDLAVVSNELFYILDDELVDKCWWNEEEWGGIWEWERDIDTGLRSGYTIAISGDDFVFVGEKDKGGEGRIAYSTDGGATFELTEAVPEPGNMQIIPDEEFAINRFIYAASDNSSSEIYRWAIGRSISWKELNPPDGGFCGLAQKGGALYGAYEYRPRVKPGVARTLIPHAETVREDDWDRLEAGLEVKERYAKDKVKFKPGTLRATSNEAIDLWAIDDDAYFNGNISLYDDPKYYTVGRLWVYSDTFVLQTPWPTSPVLDGLISCDPCDCQAIRFCFRWRQLPLAEGYDLWIALDEEFTAIIDKAENITPEDLCSPAWCPPVNSPRFTCGETYYWKVRSCRSCKSIGGEALHSRWSPPMHFTVKTCSSLEDMHTAPILEVPQSGSRDVPRSPSFSWIGFPETTKYEFILAKDADFMQIIDKKEIPTSAYQCSSRLDWSTTYFWQVKALEPVPSEPATSVFTVMQKPEPVAPVIPSTPLWIWVIIGILTLLDVLIIALCLVRR